MLRPIAIGDTFQRVSAKCIGYNVFERQQARPGSREVGVGSESVGKWPDIFFDSIETSQAKENVILKIVFNNAIISVNRQFILEKVLDIHSEFYMFSLSA